MDNCSELGYRKPGHRQGIEAELFNCEAESHPVRHIGLFCKAVCAYADSMHAGSIGSQAQRADRFRPPFQRLDGEIDRNGTRRIGLIDLVTSVIKHWELLVRMAKREYSLRFRGTFMGFAWAVLTPLLLAIAYTFVFVVVFKVRWVGAATENGASFVVYLMLGLAVHGILGECLARAPSLILANPNYVLRVVFPLEILAFTIIAPALVTACVNVGVAVAINFALSGQINPTLVFVPVILLPYLIFVIATVILVSAIGVYLRDIAHMIGLIITLAMFLSPVFYSIEAVPVAMQRMMQLNPLTFPIEQLRAVVVGNIMPDLLGLIIYTGFSTACLALASSVFRRLRSGFADVL